jgi:hypothetical protein
MFGTRETLLEPEKSAKLAGCIRMIISTRAERRRAERSGGANLSRNNGL